MVRKRTAGKRQTRRYRVYIVELSRECLRKPCALAPLYVGQTAHDPEHRFAQHKAGGKLAAKKVFRYGKRLRWDLMDVLQPVSTRAAAELAEKAVAEALEKRGHRVFWG